MPLKLVSPLIKDYPLEKTDKKYAVPKKEATIVAIRQARQGDFERRNDLYSEYKRTYEDGKMIVSQRISFDDVRRMEVFLTLAACNIIDDETDPDNPTPLFEFTNGRLTDENKFRKAWDRLFPDVAEEISEKVLEMNPLWSASGE